MILDAIFRSDLSIDNFPYPTEPDYKQAATKVSTMTAELKQKLSLEDFALLEQLLNLINAAQYLESTACFRTEFAVGVELQKEVKEVLDEILIEG